MAPAAVAKVVVASEAAPAASPAAAVSNFWEPRLLIPLRGMLLLLVQLL